MPKIVYSPDLHCGAPAKYRNREMLASRLRHTKRRLEALRPESDAYEAKHQYLERGVQIYTERIQQLEAEPDDRPCCLKKGHLTDHDGEGYCHWHCSCHGRVNFHSPTGNVYKQIRSKRLSQALALVQEQAADPADLTPELHALKALIVVFLEDARTRKNFGASEMAAAVTTVDKIGATVERMHRIQQKTGMVTHEAVRLLTGEMGRLLAAQAEAWDGRELRAAEFVETVRSSWHAIVVDASARALAPPHQRLAE